METLGKKHVLAAVGLVLFTALVLAIMGQPFACSCGSWSPWSSDAWSTHNSQHLFDPYSFTHFCHGLAFFWLLTWLCSHWSLGQRFLAALSLECVWELFENSPWVIEHYRQNTAALAYYGDSVLNSIGDLLSCALGFLVASAVPWWGSLAIFGLFEVGLLLTIRDNLILNILNLTGDHPSIKQWQSQVHQ